ncbi:unnamed protein product [Zymoseptoria tritici ST99CH_3D7]|uniref:Carboxylic ester hydrolase n=1 Tax=Zymoseptoria tritici (strain ST99CH_3D7) TaxID=1276538 RepID=A0A1X7S1Y1_ZYMT9|nr:unnamed protein product [Zymoseptoria tritici ST99CH_3D7]
MHWIAEMSGGACALATLLLATTTTVASPTTSFSEQCLAFQPTSLLPNSIIRLHEHIPSTTNITLPGMDSTCARTSQVVPIEACRIALTIPTSKRSSFIFEIFLPTAPAWSGRYLATGNGGIDGCIKYEDIAYGLSHGFAATGTNNGHNGTSGQAFLNNPDVVLDFSHRALHTAAEAAKVLIAAFYDKAPDKSYYIGCSGGGRQGIQSADLYPHDFDGLLVGSPALNFNYMSAWRASFYTITGANTSEGFIQAATWQGLIHDEVMRQCDELDGVRDGILADPAPCAAIFRPETLLCNCTSPATTASTNATCLTPDQVSVVRQVFSPLYGTSGQLLYPGLSPGAESAATQRLLSGTSFPYSVDWFRYAVYFNPTWDPASFTIADADVAERLNPGNARSWPADLSPLRDAGNKLLIYHGGADQQVTHFNTERWYDRLSRSMDSPSEKLDEWVRFFRIPGMGHCSGGTGAAWKFGQSAATAEGLPFEGERNVLKALVEWVEEEKAPDGVLGTMAEDGGTRWHCRYPEESVWVDGQWTCG